MTRFSTLLTAALPLLAAVAPVAAQTWTSCNPMNRTDCPDDPALGMATTFNFNQTTDHRVWNTTAGTILYSSDKGAEFTINQKGDSPTIQSIFYIFFGRVEVFLKAASGQGIISSIVLESDDLDEVDWEFIGGNTTTAETNYFGKGNTTSYDRAIYYPVNDPQGDYHNYTVVWTQAAIEWYIDTVQVRTLNYGDANGGYNFPQTPMNVRLGIWAGGDPDNSEGTIEWAGGTTNYADGPFTMYVKNMTVEDFSSGSSYKYGDKSGSYESIVTNSGESDVAKAIQADLANGGTSTDSSSGSGSSSSSSATPSSSSSASSSGSGNSVSNTWNSLSSTAKIGVYAGAGAGAVCLAGLALYCCRRQRRDGKKELLMQEEKFRQERAEYEAYQMQMRSGNFAQAGGLQY